MKKLIILFLALTTNYVQAQEQGSGNSKQVVFAAGKDMLLDKDIYDFGAKTLIIEENAILVANDTTKDGKPRKVIIKAQSIDFRGRVVVNGKGEKGRDGANGENCTSCDVKSKGVTMYADEVKFDSACKKLGKEATELGKDGENGKNGIAGTNVVFQYTKDITGYDIMKVMSNLSGGDGGEGGKGGYNKQVVFKDAQGRKECKTIPAKQKDGAKGGPGNNGIVSVEKIKPQGR